MSRIRTVLGSLLVLVAIAGVGLAEDDDERPQGPSAGELAEAILVGPEYKVAATADALDVLDEEARLRLLYELREQARIRGILEHAVVSDLSFKGVDLDSSLKALLEPWGVAWHVSAKLKAEGYQNLMVMLQMNGVSVTTVLQLLTAPHDITALVRSDGVWLVGKAEGSDGVVPSATVALRAKLAVTTMTLKVDQVKFEDVVGYVQAITGVDVGIEPRIASEVADTSIAAIHVEDIPVRTVLDMMADALGEEYAWTLHGKGVIFTRKSLLEK